MAKSKLLMFMVFIILFSFVIYLSTTTDTGMDSELTIEEKIGQLVMFGIDGYTVNETATELIRDDHIGGIILTGQNIKSSSQLLSLNNQIKNLNEKHSDIPIFISTDEEGGSVTRMPPEIQKLPSSSKVGQRNDEQLAKQVGKAIGDRVGMFGFNMTMAPVLDINSNPRNPVIGDRSFGRDKTVVSDMGIAELKGIRFKEIIPVIKHFPGHGDTGVDSHHGLPIVNHEMDRLRDNELVPFMKAIENGADMIMVAHILIPSLDKKYPSSLSKTVITDLLRDELNYDGVVITDDLTMGAIMKNHDIGDAAVLSILAGSDIILVNHGTHNRKKVLEALMTAVHSGRITEARLDESVERILQLKQKYKLQDQQVKNVNIKKLNRTVTKFQEQLQ